MATLLGEIADQRRFEISYDTDGRDRKSATRAFRVQGEAGEGENVILALSGIPQRWAQHPSDAYTFAKKRSAVRESGKSYVWVVTIHYDNDFLDDDDSGQPPNADPTLRPTKVSYRFDKFQRPAEGAEFDSGTETYSVAIVSSAGEPFDPPAMIDDSRAAIVFESKVSPEEFNFDDLSTYIDGINDAAFWGKAIRTLKIQSITAGPIQVENEIRYRPVSCEIHYREEGWNLRPLDQGSYYLDGSTVTPFKDADGQPYIYPLDGSGGEGDPDNPVFGDFIVYPQVSFSALAGLLDLPNPFV